MTISKASCVIASSNARGMAMASVGSNIIGHALYQASSRISLPKENGWASIFTHV